jgi:hypothetical protein
MPIYSKASYIVQDAKLVDLTSPLEAIKGKSFHSINKVLEI